MRGTTRDALIIALISLGVFLALGELTLRHRCSYCTWSEANLGSLATPYDFPTDSWYLLRPENATLRYRQAEFDFEVRTNSLGFRDIEHPVAKGPGEVRIAAIGDSFTEGQGAPFEETWLSVLGAKLADADDETRYGMICAGVAGSDPFFGYRVLLDKLLGYAPDLVLLVVNQSDVLDVLVRGGMERFRPDGTLHQVDPPPLTWLYKASHMARLFLFEALDYTHFIIPHTERERLAAEAMTKLQRLVVSFDHELTSRGIAFALVLVPLRNELRRDDYDSMNALRDSATEQGLWVMDAKPALRAALHGSAGGLDALYWPRDGHLTPLGYRVLAEAVMAEICPRIAAPRGATCRPH